MSVTIDIHADDFGESVHASRDILDCLKDGKLNSISVLANMSCFEECVNMYRREQDEFVWQPKISVHLNLLEGISLAGAENVPDLVNRDGHFKLSWEKLFFISFLPSRNKFKNQLKKEIELQIKTVVDAFPELSFKAIRIDSHQHTHMIPVVADALFEVIGEQKWQPEYIRDSREPIMPFLKKISLYKTFRPVNFIKNMLLKFCSSIQKKRFKEAGLAPMYLWGLIMSGHMDEKRIVKLFSAMENKAEHDGRMLEILFHPGRSSLEEISKDVEQKDAIEFYISENRTIEKQAVYALDLAQKARKGER